LYDGEFVENVQHGTGSLDWEFGNKQYVGDFVDGERTGMGEYTDIEGNKYQGKFLKGDYNGFGKLYVAETGRLYEGHFKINKLIKGKIILSDGSIYEGDIKN